MQIVLTGLNHRTAPLELRERAAFTPEQALRAAAGLRDAGILSEVVVLSTCNRSEIYGVADAGRGGVTADLELYFADFHRIDPQRLRESTYHLTDSEAVRHLFRVAAGLDSMLLGEAEILGQVRQAYRLALESASTGPVLNRLFQNALEVGKHVRTNTELAARPMSVAFAAVKLIEKVFGKLAGHQALVAGAGAMAEQVVEHLRSRGIHRMLVANRSQQRAAELADAWCGEAVAWESLGESLNMPDVVITSVSSPEPVISRQVLQRAMEQRGNRAMFIIDLGLPRNVDPAAASLYNVYLYNMDNLTDIVEENRKARHAEIPRAESIVGESAERFQRWQAGTQMIALVNQLRARVQQERDTFLAERLAGMRHLTPEERLRAARLIEQLVNRILQEPSAALENEEARARLMAQDARAVRQFLGLREEES